MARPSASSRIERMSENGSANCTVGRANTFAGTGWESAEAMGSTASTSAIVARMAARAW
jgi:hypothetical protein